MIRNSWLVQVIRAWWDWCGENPKPPITRIDFVGRTLYIEKNGTKLNVDKLKQRGKL